MSYHPPDDRPYTSYYPRPPGSSGGLPPPPPPHESGRLHSSHGYAKGPPPESPGFHHEMTAPPGSSHGYPVPPGPGQPPITPISGGNGSSYPPPPPPATGYYGLASQPQTDSMPSPPPSSNGRPGEQTLTFTPDGAPIVPVGVSGGKMFRCRGYGECDKVFTRSEHLARHVRKHTGERPFPCHCGKAFSRLDNLRQHAATVHADHAALNEAMLNSLAPVHANLSQKAGREQRKRGEIVEVPKNAVERPRHNEFRSTRSGTQQPGPPGTEFGEFPPPGWDDRPRTGYAQPYPYPDQGQVPENAGPSRRPPSSGYAAYPYAGYDQNRPTTAGGGPAPPPDGQQHPMPYPYRPMSASGRELPVPQHYSDAEPPTSAHGPPQSPMYPPVPPNQWSSSPPHSAGYPQGHDQVYPPQATPEGYYDHQQPHQQYGPPPGSPGGSYQYPPPSGYYPPGPHGNVPPHAQGQYAQYPYSGNPPPDSSPFQYSAPEQQGGQYPYGNYDRKRRADEDGGDDARKHPRPASAVPQNLNDAIRNQPPPQADQQGQGGNGNGSDPLWLPPASERRSSLAISALLGSPTLPSRSRPAGEVPSATEGATYPPQPYPYHPPESDQTANSSVSATPIQESDETRPKEEVSV